MFNDLSQFSRFQRSPQGHYPLAGTLEVSILGYGQVSVRITRPNGTPVHHRLKDVAYCPDFINNLVSFWLLEAQKCRSFSALKIRLSSHEAIPGFHSATYLGYSLGPVFTHFRLQPVFPSRHQTSVESFSDSFLGYEGLFHSMRFQASAASGGLLRSRARISSIYSGLQAPSDSFLFLMQPAEAHLCSNPTCCSRACILESLRS